MRSLKLRRINPPDFQFRTIRFTSDLRKKLEQITRENIDRQTDLVEQAKEEYNHNIRLAEKFTEDVEK